MKWITCENCEEEFRVITDSHNEVQFCPLCGNDIPEEIDEDDEDLYDDED